MKTIYWAVLLNDKDKVRLLYTIRPRHPNVYAEHMTLAFAPDAETNKKLEAMLGEKVALTVITVHNDDKGQAVGVFGDIINRLDPGHGHITISCADGVKPVYSNQLLKNDEDKLCTISPFSLEGIIAKFTDEGWIKSNG